ncbi:unnamed protein product [Peniophora sp. CBMAI 1063]|nr:unnamed protein product [Peniophora sp. CBMAI 1063]
MDSTTTSAGIPTDRYPIIHSRSLDVPAITARLAPIRLNINELPIEIFTYILYSLRDIDPPLAGERRLGWVNVTFVCSAWRKLALSYRLLWTHLPFGMGGSWYRVFLERSHPQPVDADLESGYDLNYLDIVSRSFTRVRSLSVSVSYGLVYFGVTDPVHALIMRPSETLETLVLHRYWKKCHFPRALSHLYPSLRTLHLIFELMQAEEFPWVNVGNTPGLVDLKIHLKQHEHDDQCLADIMSILTRGTALKSFDLRLSPGIHQRAPSRTVHASLSQAGLPRLNNLALCLEGDVLVHILNSITLPDSTEIVLDPTGDMEETSLTRIFLPWIASRWKAAPPSSLAFSTNGRPNRSTQIIVERDSLLPKCAVSMRIAVEGTTWDHFSDILCRLHPDSIRSLVIKPPAGLSPEESQQLSQISTICSNITHIEITSSDASAGVLESTLKRILLPATNTTAPHPFPSLTALDLTCLDKGSLSRRCTHDDDPKPYRVMPPTLAQSIVGIMKERRGIDGDTARIFLREWTGEMTQFIESVRDVARTIPGAIFLPEGTSVPQE